MGDEAICGWGNPLFFQNYLYHIRLKAYPFFYINNSILERNVSYTLNTMRLEELVRKKQCFRLISFLAAATVLSACSSDSLTDSRENECSDGETKCFGEKLASCELVDGFYTWGEAVDSEACKGENCQNECSDGDKKCVGEKQAVCEKKDDCWIWGKAVENDECKGAACTNECSDGETKCVGEKQASCEKKDDCWIWGEAIDSDECKGPACSDECSDGETKCVGEKQAACEKKDDCWIWGEAIDSDECKGAACTSECSDGETKCVGEKQASCIDKDGCWIWGEAVESDECKGAACTSECSDGETKCIGEKQTSCIDKDGCWIWGEAVESDECKGAACTSECSDGETKCVGEKQASCIDKDGCWIWGEAVESDECKEPACSDECKEGEKKCVGNDIAECIKQGECFVWGSATSCGKDKKCDSTKNACVSSSGSCVSECTKDETKAMAASSMICKDANGDGCFEWVVDKQCKQGEKFDATKKKCVSVCGDNCKPFSMIFMPDTQGYVANVNYNTLKPVSNPPNGKILAEDLKWIHDNYQKENIVAVIHHGDLTNDNEQYAWELNDKYFKQYMDSIDLPYVPAAGNHDYFVNIDKKDHTHRRNKLHMSDYGKFNDARFATKKWFGDGKGKGFYKTGNSYITVTARGIKFLILSLEFLPRKDVICWAEELIASHPDHKVIITTHAYLSQNSMKEGVRGKDGRYPATSDKTSGYMAAPHHIYGLPTGAVGPEIYQELAARHNNIILVTSGHFRASGFRLNKGNADNWFGEMIVDFQSENHKAKTEEDCNKANADGGTGAGWMRMLTFDPANYTITAKDITPLDASRFAVGKKWFVCSAGKKNYYPADPDLEPKKHLSAADPANASTDKHSFIVDYDFVTPVDYKLTEAGTPFIRRFVNETNFGYQTKPAIAANRKTRDFVVAWVDDGYNKSKKDTDGANNHDIHARVFCKTACNLVSDFVVNTTTKGDQTDPKVAMNDKGDFVVVWTNKSDSSVYLRKFDITGKQTVKETKVNSSDKAESASVSMASDGSFVVTWQINGDIFMRGFNSDGTEKIKQQKVSTATLKDKGVRNLPKVASMTDGKFIITWEDDADGDGSFDIAARGFKADGSESIKQFVVNTNTKGQQRTPAIDINEDGMFYIAWSDYADSKTNGRIRARAFDKTGKQTMADKYVSSTTTDNAVKPDVCVTGSGKAHFSWYVARDDGNAMGSSLANLKDIDIAIDGDNKQYDPAIACTNGERYIATWSDAFNPNEVEEIGSEHGDWEILCREI